MTRSPRPFGSPARASASRRATETRTSAREEPNDSSSSVSGSPLTELDESFGSSRALVRVSVARRLALARAGLPKGLGLRVIDGYRTAAAQRAIIRSYADELRVCHRAVGAAELDRLTSRFVAPMAVAPHVAGA